MSAAHASRLSGELTRGPARTRPSAGALLRPLARRVHFLAGILVAPFVLMLCLTGLVYVFSPQIHDDLYGRQLYVDEVGAAPRPVAEQVAAALAAHPEGELRSVVPPPEPDRTTRVNLSVPSLAGPGEARTVYVDPYTNFINGELTTLDGRLPANVWLRELHSNLHLGEVGRWYSETAASWLPVIVGSGLLLWIGKQGRRPRSARELLVPVARGKGEQTRLRSVHGPLGIWLTLGLLIMSVTGLMMSRFAGRGLLDAQAPTLTVAPVGIPVNATPISVDRVLEVARADGLSGEVDVTSPPAPDRPFTVVETSPGLPIQKDGIAVDPYTAEVVERIGWDDYPLLAQLRVIGVDLHTGTLFGPANQILLALLVIATIVLILVGYRMWWKRSPYWRQLPSGPPPALRQLASPMGGAVVVVAAGLGWLMPAFGVGLVAFLVVDLLINAVRQRQERVRRTLGAGALLAAGSVLGVAVLMDTSSFVSEDDASGPHPEPGTLGPSPEAERSPGAVLEQPPSRNQAAPNGALDAGTPPPTSWEAVAFPDTGPEAPDGIPDAAPGASAATPPSGTDAGGTPADRSGADDADDQDAGGGPGSGTPADGNPSGGDFRSADSGDLASGTSSRRVGGTGQAVAPAARTGQNTVEIVDDLVGTLTEVAKPVTSLLVSVVEGVTGERAGS
ncbi:PepSY domain-containing protein [Pseudonocardia xinjiangensis]|uniref:PepSY-associated TM helix domain-containing protein n=1 Tax=Pseudonocardia xinjiangensis TaxID=75289 RepID=UPI003D9015ED